MVSNQSHVIIEYRDFRFVITERPNDEDINPYINKLKMNNVTALVRVCEPTYDIARLAQEDIQGYDLYYPDGTFPSKNIIKSWFNIVNVNFSKDPVGCVAVHCIAGLGRAPVLVAITLIELGMKFEDAVELIRKKKRGAINAQQLRFLRRYRRLSRLKNNGSRGSCCVQ